MHHERAPPLARRAIRVEHARFVGSCVRLPVVCVHADCYLHLVSGLGFGVEDVRFTVNPETEVWWISGHGALFVVLRVGCTPTVISTSSWGCGLAFTVHPKAEVWWVIRRVQHARLASRRVGLPIHCDFHLGQGLGFRDCL